MAGLPWGLQKHAIWHASGSYPHAPYNLLIAMVILLIVPWVIETWYIYHETLRSVQYAKLLLAFQLHTSNVRWLVHTRWPNKTRRALYSSDP